MLWILDSAGLHAVRPVTGTLVRFWARSLVALLGIRVTVEGLERLPDAESLCFVSNHQGNFDIAILLAFLPRCIGFITKSQAAWFPFLNLWIFALGGVFIDREKVSKARAAMDRGIARLRSGAAMAIFPEGTRSRGPRMGEFHNGSFKLATRAGAVIVPISIQGTYRIWEEARSIRPSVRVADGGRTDSHPRPWMGTRGGGCRSWSGFGSRGDLRGSAGTD
ncbi:MAG: 1-acyl-sn-glycerol-3-phosphate acyltransferase [Desulfomicrobium escambiense]|nr:1-acyl-sn-glycerol-3-phosphate acyltransferase [Desulfomicrobium escambiense]